MQNGISDLTQPYLLTLVLNLPYGLIPQVIHRITCTGTHGNYVLY